MAADDFTARSAPEALEQTGARIVRFRPGCDPDAALRLIEGAIGRMPARSVDYPRRLAELTRTLHTDGAAVFDEFGLAVLDPGRCGVETARVDALIDQDDIASVRPEYRVYASGWWARLLGWEKPCAPSAAQAGPAIRPAPIDRTPPAQAPADRAPTTTWGLRAVGADQSPFGGAGVKVAILDTGFDFSHPDFQGRGVVAESFVDGESAQDGQGHGTHVAGTALGPRAANIELGAPGYGVAPEAQLFVGKVLSDSGSGREGDILAGILWALQNRCEIVSMSLGRRPAPGDAEGDYDRIGQLALDQGALIIAAAGNESARRLGQIAPVGAPANARSILAVGAVSEDRDVAPFSNGGLEADGGAVDLCAPGVDVFSAALGRARHQTLSGTSMATPHVAGVAALLAQSAPELRGRALWAALQNGAADIGLPARDGGAGLAQAPSAGAAGVA